MSRYTLDDIGSAVASLRSEVRELRRLVEQLQRGQGVRQEAPRVEHVVRDDGAVFLPGTGFTGASHSDGVEGEPLSREQMLERIRATRRKPAS